MENNSIYIWLGLFLIVAAFIGCRILFRIPKCGNVVLVTGGVKTGKTTLSVRLLYKLWRQNCMKVWIYNNIVRHFKKDKTKKEKPLIYSNVPISIPYVPLTEDLIYRRTRFVYGSVIYFCEASLLAGSMDFKDEELNETLPLLVKLIAHETKGGYLVFDTQSVLDLHYGIKRNVSSYFYIQEKIRLPFCLWLKMREMIFLDNTSNEFDAESGDLLMNVFVPTWTWRLFDCYCYSALTDNCPVERNIVKTKDLKARKIVTFKKNKQYYEVKENERKEI